MANVRQGNDDSSELLGRQLKIEPCALLIQAAGNRLQCDVVTVAKAMKLCHLFQESTTNNGKDFDQNALAIACLSLSSKISDVDFNISKKVMYKLYGIRKEQRESMKSLVEKIQAYIVNLQNLLCHAISWNFSECETAHKYVFHYVSLLKAESHLESTFSVIPNHVSRLLATFYLCKRSIHYEPEQIAVATLRMALQHAALDVDCINCLKRELDAVPNVDAVIEDMLIVCDVSTSLVKSSTNL